MSTNYPTTLDTASGLFTVVNGVNTTLNGAVDSSQTTLTVVDATNFPTVGYVVIDTEVILYTGKTGTTLTGCTRAADSSAAASHTSGSIVYSNMVADHHNVLLNAIVAIETLLGSSSQNLDLSARAGLGIYFKTPDGTHVYQLTIDNNGMLATTQIS